MLYDRWRQIARNHAAEVALIDATTRQRWTFQQLNRASEAGLPDGTKVAFPQGTGAEFVFAVLRAWRSGAVVCPLETDESAPLIKRLPHGCVHLKSTSASTGKPRGIAFAGEQLAADAANIVATMRLTPQWPNLGVISLAHSYGFSNLVLPLLLHAVPLVLAGSPLPESVRRAASLLPAVTLPAVPALWRAWFEAGTLPGNVQIAISAGAPLPLGLESDVYEKQGLKIHNFYGSSECGGIAYDSSPRPREDPNSVGSIVSGVGLSLGPGGCLCVRGAAVGLTYWPEPAPNLGGGVFQTSDLAEIVGSQVFLRGRQSDQINVAGRKVSPEHIERVLAQHPLVRECLVFGAPSPDLDRTEMIVACVALRSETPPEILRQHLLQHLPAWQIPRDWWFVPNLETNTRGKLARGQWRQQYLSGKRTGQRTGRGSTDSPNTH